MKIQETVRHDGLRIISCYIPTQTKVLVSLSALVGSAHDPVNKQGLFHLFEHMAFRGTKKRNATQIKDFLNRNVLNSNATTARLQTEYWGTAITRKLHLLCDIITDIYAHSTFPTAGLKQEKSTVLLEAARNRDDDTFTAYQTLRELLYSKSPLSQFTTGTEEGIKGVTREHLLKEKEKWYVPSNTLAVAVGKVSHTAFVREMSEHIPEKKIEIIKPVWDNELDILPKINRREIDRGSRKKSTIVMGCKIADDVSDRLDIIEGFMTSLLVSGWSSRLWNEVREKRGLAYTVSGGITRNRNLGAYFYVFVQTKPGKEKLVESLMRKAIFTPLSHKDKGIFEDTKEAILDSIDAGFGESLDRWYDIIFEKIMKEEPLSSIKRYFSEQRKIVKSISLRDAEKMRKELMKPERFATVILKPGKNT